MRSEEVGDADADEGDFDLFGDEPSPAHPAPVAEDIASDDSFFNDSESEDMFGSGSEDDTSPKPANA